MSVLTIHAIYEEGKLRPLQPLPLQEQEQVLLQVIRESAVQETSGMLQGLDPEVVREVAEGEEFSVNA
jgi:predicted DNA-binding antitoxin AbrB/MazE fold protein